MGFPASSSRAHRQGNRVAAVLSERTNRAKASRIPFRVGQVLVRGDPFNGRCLGTVAVFGTPYVGLRTPGGTPQDIASYDYRQLRYPD